MDFRTLQNRLLQNVKSRVRNGEITERGLARLTGFSQPHVHNVLKGVRPLSNEFADALLCHLRIGLAGLLAENHGEPPAGGSAASAVSTGLVRFLAGPIGPGYPYPAGAGRESYPFLLEDLAGLDAPVAARLAYDPAVANLLGRDAVALLDCALSHRRYPDEENLYAVNWQGESAIRRARTSDRRLYLGFPSGRDGREWRCIGSLDQADLIVRARVHLFIRRP